MLPIYILLNILENRLPGQLLRAPDTEKLKGSVSFKDREKIRVTWLEIVNRVGPTHVFCRATDAYKKTHDSLEPVMRRSASLCHVVCLMRRLRTTCDKIAHHTSGQRSGCRTICPARLGFVHRSCDCARFKNNICALSPPQFKPSGCFVVTAGGGARTRWGACFGLRENRVKTQKLST